MHAINTAIYMIDAAMPTLHHANRSGHDSHSADDGHGQYCVRRQSEPHDAHRDGCREVEPVLHADATHAVDSQRAFGVLVVLHYIGDQLIHI